MLLGRKLQIGPFYLTASCDLVFCKTLLWFRGKRKFQPAMSPDLDWKNLGGGGKSFSPPPQRGRPPTPQTVGPRPLIHLKRGGTLRAAFIQHCLSKKITFALLVSILFLSLNMLRMLKRQHLHPGMILLLLWLCYLIEDQKVQGECTFSIFVSSKWFFDML